MLKIFDYIHLTYFRFTIGPHSNTFQFIFLVSLVDTVQPGRKKARKKKSTLKKEKKRRLHVVHKGSAACNELFHLTFLYKIFHRVSQLDTFINNCKIIQNETCIIKQKVLTTGKKHPLFLSLFGGTVPLETGTKFQNSVIVISNFLGKTGKTDNQILYGLKFYSNGPYI